jgi:hypothetical protein
MLRFPKGRAPWLTTQGAVLQPRRIGIYFCIKVRL